MTYATRNRGRSVTEKRPEREIEQTLPSSAEVYDAWIFTFTPSTRLHGTMLRNRDNFTSYFYLNLLYV